MDAAFPLEDLQEPIALAVDHLRAAKRIAVLTGAGVSAESGVKTFRDSDGLWEGHNVEDVATPTGFQRDPELVWRFYNERRTQLREVQPNPGHHALAQLEDRAGDGNFALITQNVDGLHRAAGSRNILELHGSIRIIRCSKCTFAEDRGIEPQDELPRCPKCQELLRPGVVWFGEALPPDVWADAEDATRRCDCFLVVGTSAVVWPAAGLILQARDNGAKVIEINVQKTAASSSADVGLYGPSGQILPKIMEQLDSSS